MQLEPHKSLVSVNSSGGQPSPGGRSTGLPVAKEQQQQQQPRDDVNGVLDNSPIYVTSVPNLTSELPRDRSRSRSSTPNRTSPSPRRHHSTRSSRDTPPSPLTPSPRREAPTLKDKGVDSSSAERSSRRSSRRKSPARLANGHHGAEAEADANKSGDELELTHDLNDTLDDTEDLDQDPPEALLDRTDSEDKVDLEGTCLSESGDSLPGTPEKAYGIVRSESKRSRSSRRDRGAQREVLLDHDPQQEVRAKTPLHAVSSIESRDSTR